LHSVANHFNLQFGQGIHNKVTLLSAEIDLQRTAGRTSKILKVRNEVIRKNGSNANNSGRNEK
jgi:hypothetical protein